MNASKKVVVAVITDVTKLESIANFADGTVIKYAVGIQFETLRDAFEHAYPTKTLYPIGMGNLAYTTYGANSAIIIYHN